MLCPLLSASCRLALFAAFPLLGSSLGCSSTDTHPPALGDCVGEGCLPNGGSSSGGADGGADVAVTDGSGLSDAQTASLSGSLVLLSDEFFEQPQPLLGTGTLHVPTPTGDQIIAYGADAGEAYQADSVLVGTNWFSVFPATSPAGTTLLPYSTWSLLTVPTNGADNFDIPVVDRSMISVIYAALDTPIAARTDAAQVVLVFRTAGQRVPGISITQHPSCEAVAYDTGAGYSTTATATSTSGVAILVNTQGAGALDWTATSGATGSFSVVFVPDQASFVAIEVP